MKQLRLLPWPAVLLIAFLMVLGLPVAQAQNASTIDAARTGSLTIHKSEGDPFTQYGDPSRGGATAERAPLEGIPFEIRRVTSLDVSSNKGWRDYAKTNIEDFFAGGAREKQLGEKRVASTDANGNARFDDLPLGFYYVSELPTVGQDRSLSLIRPFIVSVPGTDPATRERWLYDVTVNAKDQRLQINKARDRERGIVGDEIRYTMSATSPAPQADGKIHRYEIVDPLQSDLTYIGNPEVTLTDGHGKQEILPGSNYRVEAIEGRIVRMQLNERGREKLAAIRLGNPAAQVTLSFTTRIARDPDDHVIRNTSYLLTEGYPEFDSGKPRQGVPSNEVTTIVEDSDPGNEPSKTPTPTSVTSTEPTTSVFTPVPPPSDEPSTVTSTRKTTIPNESITREVGTGERVTVTNVREANSRENVTVTGIPGSDDPRRSGPLASTGADVLWAAGVGAVLVLAGIFLATRRREDSNE
ncbi:SpaH/EbpB family LPXTG-anchored major pilin [Corynebacterium sp. Marseille-P4321]|uniref:SpaH/EbpB family LPXTG-anchored major pilin n=1 Tax=Corynebacterium sp. Marseille-P4321 TaxID=2736603 RepID=UPI00158C91DC|nr:SpaH/EbpB family LPXTG-anchored major pilin [Corynebacterium sp. Marseille-P4321]